MYVDYSVVKGIEYASAVSSCRDGDRVGKDSVIYLGRVVDKKEGIYKSRERGYFKYDVQTGVFESMPEDFKEPGLRRKQKVDLRAVRLISFGDVYLLDTYIREMGLYDVADAVELESPESLHALLLYNVLSNHPTCFSEEWRKLTYAGYLYPGADLSLRKLGELLERLGKEVARMGFLKKYRDFIKGTVSDETLSKFGGYSAVVHSISISDATGTYAIEPGFTGQIFYASQWGTGLPLFYEVEHGDGRDVQVVVHTLSEMEKDGLDIESVIYDAGDYTESFADALIGAGVPFFARVRRNYRLYDNVVSECERFLGRKTCKSSDGSMTMDIKHTHQRIVTSKGRQIYAYLCHIMTATGPKFASHDKRGSDDVAVSNMSGYQLKSDTEVFVSSRDVSDADLVELICERGREREIRGLMRRGNPYALESEDTLRGQLLVAFMVTDIARMAAKKLYGTSYTTERAFMLLHEHHGAVCDNKILTEMPTPEMVELYEIFGLACPGDLPFSGGR